MNITALSAAALVTGAGLLLVAGCSGPASSSESAAAGAPARAPAGSAALAPRAASPAGPGSSAVQAARPAPAAQSIIYTASATIQVQNVTTAASSVSTYVSGAGGYVSAEQAQTTGSATQRPTISLTLKVPVAGYPAALHWLAGPALGRETSVQQQSTDVTQQVADVASRVTSEQAAIAALRTLLRRAGSLSGLLQVQQQISSDESSLEALLAQQRALSHETTYATVTALLLGRSPHRVSQHHSARRGFLAGLAAGWRGLRHATSWALTVLGAVLPFAVIVAILGGLGYGARRRSARRRGAPDRPASSPSP
jgi:hypothetical protein